MAFLYPLFLLGALAVAVPIVLHLLRRDIAPQVPFSAVRLLSRTPIERSRRHRLRDLLLLAARVAALLLLALAFARPYLRHAEPAGTLVVAVDRSFSMAGPARFERALELARAAVRDGRPGERIAVIAFDDRAEVVATPGGPSDALTALAALKPGFGATRYARLFDVAASIAQDGPGRLVVVTDLQRAGWADRETIRMPADWIIELKDVGGFSNMAVSAVRVESDRVVASIQSSWKEPRTGRIRLSVGDREVRASAYTVQAGGSLDVPLEFEAPDAGGLAVTVDDPGGLPADDARYVVLGRPQSRALIVTGGAVYRSGFYLQRALATSAELEDGISAEIVAGAELSKPKVDELETRTAIVLLSTRGVDRPVRDAMAAFTRRGGGLIVCAAPEVEPSVVSAVFDWTPPLSPALRSEPTLALAATDVRHPVFRPFGALTANLGRVRFERTWRVASPGWEVVARFSDGTPALLERREGDGRVLLFASDVDRRWNDFPVHPAFVPFAIETVRYAGGARVSAREFRVADVPAGVAPRPGFHTLGTGKRMIAVNADTSESAPERATEAEFGRMVARDRTPRAAATGLQVRQAEAAHNLWRYGLLLMLAALVAESVAGRA